MSDILNQKEHLDIKRETYPYNIDFRAFGINAVGDKKIVTGGFKEGYWGILDSQNNIIPNVVELPFDAGEVPELEKGVVFGGMLKANIFRKPGRREAVMLLIITKVLEE